jgi:hypothetical protein
MVIDYKAPKKRTVRTCDPASPRMANIYFLTHITLQNNIKHIIKQDRIEIVVKVGVYYLIWALRSVQM